MKREAVGTTKMKRLCKLLNVRLYVAVGIMESLWHLTAREAPQGDIGKLCDEDIALGIDWDGPPEQLVGALVKARWVDESGTHRLIVHDWDQHADDAVDIRLARGILLYANGAQPRMARLSRDEKAKLCAQYAHDVRTEAHEKPLPVPVPVPVPVPEPEGKATAPPPEPPRRVPQARPGANGEFLAATWLLQELGIASHASDISVIAQVIAFEARSRGDTRESAEWILQETCKARERGEHITVFWLKDRKFSAPAGKDIYAEYLAKG